MRALVSFVLLLALPLIASAQSYVAVALWANDAAHAPVSARLTQLLHARQIEAVVTCSAGCTLSVDAPRFAEARAIIGEAITREHLDVRFMPTSPPS